MAILTTMPQGTRKGTRPTTIMRAMTMATGIIMSTRMGRMGRIIITPPPISAWPLPSGPH